MHSHATTFAKTKGGGKIQFPSDKGFPSRPRERSPEYTTLLDLLPYSSGDPGACATGQGGGGATLRFGKATIPLFGPGRSTSYGKQKETNAGLPRCHLPLLPGAGSGFPFPWPQGPRVRGVDAPRPLLCLGAQSPPEPGVTRLPARDPPSS